MNKLKAMKLIDDIFNDFKYIYTHKINLEITAKHFTFSMGYLPEIQLTIHFRDEYLDVLAFPHPVIVNENNINEMILTINYINSIVKSLGHFYVDDNNDIAYTLRLNYDLLEKLPKYCLEEIETSIDFYCDILETLYRVSNGNLTYFESKEIINNIWSIN